MVTSADRLRVLKMIEEGKISASDGIRMLDTVEAPSTVNSEVQAAVQTQAPRWIRVLVTDTDTGKARVNVRLPVNLVNTGIKMGAHLSSEVDALDMQQINDFIKRGVTGQVLDVFDDEDSERVEIFLE